MFTCWHTMLPRKKLGYTKIGKTTIGDNVFIGAGVIVLPGVAIGDRVIVGAGSVVTKDIPAGSVAIGNPAKVICTYDQYMDKQRASMSGAPLFAEKPDKVEQEEIKEYLNKHRVGDIE